MGCISSPRLTLQACCTALARQWIRVSPVTARLYTVSVVAVSTLEPADAGFTVQTGGVLQLLCALPRAS